MKRPGRLLELVTFLGGRRAYTVDEIAGRFGVSPRTAYRDLGLLQEAHVPLVKEERGYKLMEDATLRPLDLTAAEHALLKVALANPQLGRQPSLATTLAALEAKLDAATARVEESPRALQLAALDRSGPNAETALPVLREAIERRCTVRFRYASLSGGTTKRRGLDPWRLFQRAEAWYAVGRCHVHDEPRLFRLDRMTEVEVTGEPFTVPAGFDLDAFLERAWEVFVGPGEHQVVLTFDRSLAPLVENAVHHPGETTRRMKDGTIEYRATVSALDEIARWIVAFGGRARVVSPPELAELAHSIASRAAEALHKEPS
jgi:predicted DNA-binding transcriptional regulator YafY